MTGSEGLTARTVARVGEAWTQDPKLYRRLDADKVAERVVDVFRSADTEFKKIFAPMGRSTQLPIGMSDGLSINDKAAAERLQIDYAC